MAVSRVLRAFASYVASPAPPLYAVRRAMADTPTSAPGSSGSYTDGDMRELADWQVEVTKTFKVPELDEV